MVRKLRAWFRGLSKAGKAGVILSSLLIVSAAAGPSSTTSTSPQPIKQDSIVQPISETSTDTVEKKKITETVAIPFEKTSVRDSTLDAGKTIVQTTGINGVKTLNYEITLTNGAETSKLLLKEEVTTKPVTEVTAIGTKVTVAPPPDCPNGTYTNTYGSVVCRPYESNSVPAGATARCSDGTYSFSQTRRGTCSGHRGVSQWL